MTLVLSSADQQALARASHLMTSPLDHPSADAWRAAVNRALMELMVGDSAAFVLPGVGGAVFFSEEHDPTEGAKYTGLEPPPLSNGQTVWERQLELRVCTSETLYGLEVGRYFRSAYYNEYAGANGARRALAASLPLATGKPSPTQMANALVWRSWTSGKNGGAFGVRERQLFELLFPSLQAGIEALLQWQQHRVDLLRAIDVLGQAVLVCDQDGAVLHETGALTAALGADTEAESVRAALLRMARAHRIGGGPGVHVQSLPVAEVRTARARYCLRATAYGTPRERQPLTLVSLERLTPLTPSADEARRHFGLTPSEVRVAFLLAEGRSNAYVADALGVRESTARRHTEHVLAKLKVRTRAAVGPRLLGQRED